MANKLDDTIEEWKSNIEAAKKEKFLRELEQLRFQSKTLEREKVLQVYTKRGEYRKHYCELEDVELNLNEELKNERMKIDQHLRKIKTKVDVFQCQLKDVKPTPEFVEKLRETMEDIESTITAFKQQQRKIFETLLTDEGNIEHEIEIIQARIDTLSSVKPGVGGSKSNNASKLPQTTNFPPEVKSFEKYLSQFGSQGGWDDYDHGSFLKIRNRLKGKPSFMRIAANNIPGRTYNDIKEHEEWYRRFVELRDAKKNAILEWKIKKEREQLEVIPDSTEADAERERLSKEKENKEQVEREQKKKELEEWKARKAEQAKREMEEIERNEKRKKKIKEQEEMKMNEIREAARDRLRLKKEEQERQRWRVETEQEELKAVKAEQAQLQIQKFQSRDERNLKMKQRERKRKEEEEKLRKERIQRARANVKVASDRNRLYQPTDAWIRRNKEQNDKSAPSLLTNMPHRAIPSWRQGM